MCHFLLFKDIIHLHISCPSDKEEEKSTRDACEKEDKGRSKEKAPGRMLSRGEGCTWATVCSVSTSHFLRGKEDAVQRWGLSHSVLCLSTSHFLRGKVFYFVFVLGDCSPCLLLPRAQPPAAQDSKGNKSTTPACTRIFFFFIWGGLREKDIHTLLMVSFFILYSSIFFLLYTFLCSVHTQTNFFKQYRSYNVFTFYFSSEWLQWTQV